MRKIFLILSLLILNRLDYLILFLPLLIYLIWNCRQIKQLFHATWPGILLLIVWFVFATVYFGFPLPNTFYAKLNTGYPIDEVLLRGWHYFVSMNDDLASVLIIFIALVLTIFIRSALLICLTLGQIMYCLYILRIGGDFMLGRYFAILVFNSVGQIIISLLQLNKIRVYKKNFFILGLFTTLLIIGVFERYPFRSAVVTDSRRVAENLSEFDSQILDARSLNRPKYGLLSKERENWPNIFVQGNKIPENYRIICNNLEVNSLVDSNTHLVDVCGLTDPFISRLPAVYEKNWKIGQHFRKVPTNYGDFKLGKLDSLDDSA